MKPSQQMIISDGITKFHTGNCQVSSQSLSRYPFRPLVLEVGHPCGGWLIKALFFGGENIMAVNEGCPAEMFLPGVDAGIDMPVVMPGQTVEIYLENCNDTDAPIFIRLLGHLIK